MSDEVLKISVLYGTGVEQPSLPSLLKDIAQVEVVSEIVNPEGLLSQDVTTAPDSVLVYLNGELTLPPWLADLAVKLPRTAILLCSESKEPDILIRAMQLGIREFLPLPLGREELEAALQRVRLSRQRLEMVPGTQGRIIVVTAHKGGAGVTSVALNLAEAIREQESGPVVLVDLGRPFPDIGNFLDQESSYSIHDLVMNLADLDRDFVRRIVQGGEGNLAVLHGITELQYQDSLGQEALEKILTLLRSLYSWIVVDLSHWLDELFLHTMQQADVVILLSELTVPDLRNLSHLWPTLRDYPEIQNKVRVVVNRYVKGGPVSLRNLEKLIKASAYHFLPSDYEPLIEAINRGMPLSQLAPRSKLWQSLQILGQRLVRELLGEEDSSSASRSWLRLLPLSKEK